METITTYLENVFKSLPQTPEVLRIKNELLADMEAKYGDLYAQGASEHEATARVIGEFGNIEELLVELGIDMPFADGDDGDSQRPMLSREEVDGFLAAFSRASLLIGSGVALILFGVATLVGTHGAAVSLQRIPVLGIPIAVNISRVSSAAMAFLLLLVAVAVGLFIYAGAMISRYRRLEQGEFNLAPDLERELTHRHDTYRSTMALGISIGVGLILLGVAGLFIIPAVYASYAVSFLLLLIAAAVFLFIRAGMTNGAYQRLLRIGDYTSEKREADRVIGAVAAFVWPLVVCVFLVWGFLFDGWSIAWVVFPITALLFGGFAGLYSTLKGTE
ncbi:MAG: permease prefix domain 1-containing protein [Coriobacteriia bacterium]|nr:permease prefix domain 1-containing protein [Coriobacteriia bacterium]